MSPIKEQACVEEERLTKLWPRALVAKLVETCLISDGRKEGRDVCGRWWEESWREAGWRESGVEGGP